MAIDRTWISQELAAQNEKYKAFQNDYLICFLTGKSGKQWLPVFIPNDCIDSIKFLINPVIRTKAEIHPDNKFAFAQTGSNLFHGHGSNDFMIVCQNAQLKKNITATENRHYISTEFAKMDVPAHLRKEFFRILGHSEEINQNIYQNPTSSRILGPGEILSQIDREFSENNASSDVSSFEDRSKGKSITNSSSEGSSSEDSLEMKSREANSSCDGSPSEDSSKDKSKEEKSSRMIWPENVSNLIKDYFEEYINTESGRNPSKDEILNFIDTHNIQFLKDLNLNRQEQYRKLRIKIINTRNLYCKKFYRQHKL